MKRIRQLPERLGLLDDAVEQYKRDRDPRETLFAFGRCVVHFAVDDSEVRMCTALKGTKGMAKDSWFLPFNQGWNDGAGNPPNPEGLKTDYTMKQAIQEGFILDVLKHYTPVASYYRLAKTVVGDPEYDVKKARKKLRVYVEGHSKAIRDKAEIMVDHFLEQVVG